jgi:hypothetical protein
MIVLSQTTDNLQVVLAGAVVTNQLQCFSCWRDRTSTTFVAGRTRVNTNNTTDVNLVAAPAASTQRIVDFISIYNADTADATVTVKIDDNGTEAIIKKEVLSPGDTLTYVEGSGFEVARTFQPIKSFTVHGDASANFAMTNATLAERWAGNTSRHLFMVDLLGYTQVRLRGNKMVGSASVNTPLFRAKYYTSFNTTVGNFLQLGLSGQVEFSMTATGYGDTGWMNLATAARTTGICIGFTELGGDGVADPALGATDIIFR